MTYSISRRQIVQSTLIGLGAATIPQFAFSQTGARIVIIGGGFGGATAAKALKTYLPNANVTLIEKNANYAACPFSNLVIGGFRDISAQTFSYDALATSGVQVVGALATDIDAEAQSVVLEDGTVIGYDRLILSPGIDIRWNPIEGYDETAADTLPHAWKAGAQTLLLRRQLEALEDGQTVVMTVPPAPFRCPPGPYERASLIAHYLKTQKPRSKLLVLDAKERFSKMALFQEAWSEHYPEHLEWRGALDDGSVNRVDAANRTVYTDFEEITADVINIIPPQKAGSIAERAGVTDATGWCPIDPLSFESPLSENIHVLGDATIAAPMPKSAFSANLQAKVCAVAVARMISGLEPQPTTLANTCYSYTTPDEAVSISGVYTNASGALESISGAGGVSPLAAEKAIRATEAAQAAHWFETITSEAFG